MRHSRRTHVAIVLLQIASGAILAAAVSTIDGQHRAVEVGVRALTDADRSIADEEQEDVAAVEVQKSLMVPRSRLIRQEQAPSAMLETSSAVEATGPNSSNDSSKNSTANNSNTSNSSNATTGASASLERTFVYNYETDRSKHDKHAITKSGDYLDPLDVPDIFFGASGKTGKKGLPGSQGPNGKPGIKGERGYTGLSGIRGPPGKTVEEVANPDNASKGMLVLLIMANGALVGGLFIVMKSTHKRDGTKRKLDGAHREQLASSQAQGAEAQPDADAPEVSQGAQAAEAGGLGEDEAAPEEDEGGAAPADDPDTHTDQAAAPRPT